MAKKSEEYNWKAGQKYIDSLHKLSVQLEKITGKMPKILSKGDKICAMAELEVIIRKADRLEYQIKYGEN